MMDREKYYVIVSHRLALLISMMSLEKFHWIMDNSPEYLYVMPALMPIQDIVVVVDRCRQK